MTITEIKQNYRIEDVIGKIISLKKQGTQLVGKCPFHNDNQVSFKISPSKQIWHCWPCSIGGDMFDFFKYQGLSVNETKNTITNGSIIPIAERLPEPPKPEWHDALPDRQPDLNNISHYKYGKPSRIWTYHNSEAIPISYVCRFDLGEGNKDVLPYSFKTDGLKSGWMWKGLDLLRPLYNLHKILSRPNDPILMVEGEKAAEAAELLFPKFVISTWIAGGESVKNTDLSPLEGREVILWPDNDLPGILCMFGGWKQNEKTGEYRRVKGLCELVIANFHRVHNKPEFPKKWDVADADWTPEEANQYLKENMSKDLPIISEYAPNQIPVPAPNEIPVPVYNDIAVPVPPAPEPPINSVSTSEPPIQQPIVDNNNPFMCLGFEHDGKSNTFVFYVFRSNVVVKLSASGITPQNVLQLANINYWEGKYPGGRGKFNISMASDHLISQCYTAGMFNPEHVRGRGAWIDNKIPVIHCGNYLIVDGTYKLFQNHKSKFVYQAGYDLGFNLTKPLTKDQAYKFFEVIDRLQWNRDISSRMFSGWIVIAPLCGALNWRPHIWITGAAGSGKTWVVTNPIKHMLGEIALHAQSSTSAAGIRQLLGSDALPVVIDEAEAEGVQGQQRIKEVVELARAASSSSSKIYKGSTNGTAIGYLPKSCFAFASIGVNISKHADEGRIMVMELMQDKRLNQKEEWEKTQSLYYDLVTPEYISAFQSRSVLMLPTILKNADTFSKAVRIHLNNQRTGDQLGVMLAGVYSLMSDDLISMEDALTWVKERNWDNEKLSERTKDEVQVLEIIINSEIEVQAGGYRYTRTVGELILNARGDVMPHAEIVINEQTADVTLRRAGIRVDGFKVLFAYKSKFITKCLQGSDYQNNYHTMLARLEGAEKVEKTTFASGMAARAVRIDSRVIFGELEHPGMIIAQSENVPMPIETAEQVLFNQTETLFQQGEMSFEQDELDF